MQSLKIDDGAEVWRQPLPAPAVKGGLALDHEARLFLSLQDGRVLCLAETQTNSR